MNTEKMTPTIDPNRLAIVESLSLKSGGRLPPPDEQYVGMCVMEAVAFVAGEEWSDHPQCASTVISTFLRTWNDCLPSDSERDRLLKPLILKLVGSKGSDAVELKRSYMAFDWMVRIYLPAFLRLTPTLKPHADTISELLEIVDKETVDASSKFVAAAGEAAREAARDAAWDAAGEAAWDAARDAAGEAAWAAAGEAARDAAWDAAREAAWAAAGEAAWDAARDAAGEAAWAAAGEAAWAAAGEAARDAAWDAARDAAGEAARVAAGSALAPTVKILQESALELIERMLAVTE